MILPLVCNLGQGIYIILGNFSGKHDRSATSCDGKRVKTQSNTAYGVIPARREEPEYEVIRLPQHLVNTSGL